jgi:di/tripeptidase
MALIVVDTIQLQRQWEGQWDLDAISMGPDMKNVHSTDEWVDVASVGRVYEYLTRVLEQL